jgi:hypothetical protein
MQVIIRFRKRSSARWLLGSGRGGWAQSDGGIRWAYSGLRTRTASGVVGGLAVGVGRELGRLVGRVVIGFVVVGAVVGGRVVVAGAVVGGALLCGTLVCGATVVGATVVDRGPMVDA